MDLGGHRFFSKSDWVMRWWQEILPLAPESADPSTALRISYQGRSRALIPEGLGPASSDAVMLVRQRLSRIFYRRRFFDYPLTLNAGTFGNLGLIEAAKIGLSYGHSHINPRTPEMTLEDFLVNRFGDPAVPNLLQELYREGMGGTLPGNICGMGCSADKGPVHRESACACGRSTVSRSGIPFAETRRDQLDRTVPLPQIWPRPTMGRGRPPSSRPRRKGASSPSNRRCRTRRRPCHGRQRRG